MKDSGAKPSAFYVREFRERMRRAGLVKKDVWIRPEFAAELAQLEKRLRLMPGEAVESAGFPAMPGGDAPAWSLDALQHAIEAAPPVQAGTVELTRLDGADPVLCLVMREYGDLPVFLALGGLQIVVQALMWPVDHVVDPAAFNAHVLRTHKLVPLTTMGIEPVAGVPCYVMFGSLDTHSSLSNILFEIETLAANVIACVDAYRPFLRDDVLAHEAAA